jgi:hypothetical protein
MAIFGIIGSWASLYNNMRLKPRSYIDFCYM